ncbi:TVP38/TMEM64 family protein [Phreatobacter sp.]|uniref:TVP38/TMEM64 family protein n=1 Tax=Phreatobacter sp. TaxID=1966341 RepID=UPI003F6F34E9
MDVRRFRPDRRLVVLVLVVALVVGLKLSGIADLLSIETLRQHRAAIAGWAAAHPVVAPAAYAAIYAAVVALAVPGAVWLTLAGGFLFGAVMGTGLAVLAATTGAVLVFLAARRLFGADAVDRLGPKAARLAAGLRNDAWSYLLVLRLVPVFPFFLVNLVPAFSGVRLPVFAATTLVGIVPATAVFATAGSGLGDVLDQGGAVTIGSILTPKVALGLAGLGLLSLAGIPLRRYLDRRQRDA